MCFGINIVYIYVFMSEVYVNNDKFLIFSEKDVQYCEAALEKDGVPGLSQTELQIKDPLGFCQIGDEKQYQALKAIIQENPQGENFIPKTFLWSSRQATLRPMDEADIPILLKQDMGHPVSETRLENFRNLSELGFVGTSLQVDESNDAALALLNYHVLASDFLNSEIPTITAEELTQDVNKRGLVIESLMRFCPKEDWDKVGIDRRTFLSGLSDQNLVELLNGPYRMHELYIGYDMQHRDSAKMIDGLIGFIDPEKNKIARYLDCNQWAALSLNLLATAHQSGMTDLPHLQSLVIPGHATLVYEVNHQGVSHEIYFNNGMELLPPGYFNLDPDKTIYAKQGETQVGPTWELSASFYSDKVSKNTEAQRATVQSVQISPGSSLFLKNLSAITFDQSDKHQALSIIQLAIKLNSQDPENFTKMGIYYYTLGKMEEAVQTFDKAKALDSQLPSGEEKLPWYVRWF